MSGKDRQLLPGIGLQVSSQTEQLSDGEIERLRELHLDHVRVDVTPADQTASAKLPELNRQRPDPATVDVVSYGINPQIHAYDNTSIIETLEIQGETVHSAKQFVGDRPLLISPITLKKQAISEPPPVGELPANVDPRQTSMFVAGWTLGSIKYLAEAGAEKRHLFRNGRLAQHHGSRRRLAAAARSARVSRPRRFRRPQVSSERPARDRRGRPSVHAQCGVGRPAHSGR